MSSIFKLSIQGIRSFDGEKEETIQFGFPLTLICGQNGCGKTTIIECLKYATTGDLPPNSKGGAFINDPSIANRNIVHGQIKLAFKSVNDKSMIVTRSMQLSKRRGRGGASTLTFKTLEGQLSAINKGVKAAISSKNAELDTQVPIYLGASKAILDYVIFCHQDDSLWPLSEASVLKKRFDDIFEALKYTKVLDNLKNVRKEMATNIKLIEQSVQHLKIDKNRASKIKQKLKENQLKVDQYTEDIAELTMQIERFENEANDLFESNQQFQATLSEYERLKMIQENLSINLEKLRSSINLLDDTDEELSHSLSNFAQINKDKKSLVTNLENQIRALDTQLTKNQSEFHKYTRIEGSLSNKRQIYDQNILKIDKYFKKSEDFEINFDTQTNDSSARLNLKNQLQEKLKTSSLSFKKNQESYKNQLSQLEKELHEIQSSITKEDQHNHYCTEDINNANLKIHDLRKKLTSLHYDESTLEFEKTELENLISKYNSKKDSSTLDDLEKKIQADNSTLVSLEYEMDEISRKITSSNRQSDLHARLSVQKDSLSSKNDFLKKTITRNNEKFKNLIGQDLKADTCQTILNESIGEVSRTIHMLEMTNVSQSNELHAKNSQLDAHKNKLDEYKTSLAHHKQRILQVIEEDEIDEYEKVVQELEEDHNTTLHNLNTFDVTKNFKIKAIELAKIEKCCTLCKRPFEGNFMETFISQLQDSVNGMSVQKLQENVDSTRKDVENVKLINVDILEYRKLITLIPEMTSKIHTEEDQASSLLKENKKLQEDLSNAKANSDNLETLQNPIRLIRRLLDDVEEFKKQIDVLKDELNDFGASSLSLSELQKLHQTKNLEAKTLRQVINEGVESKYVQQRELTRLDSNIKDKRLAISNLENSLSEITNIKRSIDDFEVHVTSLKEKKLKIEIILEDLVKKKEDKNLKYQDLYQDLGFQEEQENSKLKELENFVSNYNVLYESVEEFETKDSILIEQNSQSLEESRHQIEKIGQDKAEKIETVAKISNEINEASSIERNIRDNIELRSTECQISEVGDQMIALNIENAEIERENYHTKSRKIREKLSDLNSENAGKIGEIKQIKDQVKNLEDELRSEFQDVDKKYKEESVKLQVNLLVSNDVMTYSKALDNAIMKYHSAKMEDINRILRELWNQTYKGTDIDTIEIRSDVNTQAKGNRSYNYRVVMFKNDIELDMRGRCSAGQKVLTSILIRLALAECFGSSCGMIALDEPTTNLDLENAESLAIALNNIIQFRKNQKNFQLIVITHDEKFLSHINGDNFTDHFYRVQRDEDQKSAIRSLPIHLIQDE